MLSIAYVLSQNRHTSVRQFNNHIPAHKTRDVSLSLMDSLSNKHKSRCFCSGIICWLCFLLFTGIQRRRKLLQLPSRFLSTAQDSAELPFPCSLCFLPVHNRAFSFLFPHNSVIQTQGTALINTGIIFCLTVLGINITNNNVTDYHFRVNTKKISSTDQAVSDIPGFPGSILFFFLSAYPAIHD